MFLKLPISDGSGEVYVNPAHVTSIQPTYPTGELPLGSETHKATSILVMSNGMSYAIGRAPADLAALLDSRVVGAKMELDVSALQERVAESVRLFADRRKSEHGNTLQTGLGDDGVPYSRSVPTEESGHAEREQDR
jgi:hypothetical protein